MFTGGIGGPGGRFRLGESRPTSEGDQAERRVDDAGRAALPRSSENNTTFSFSISSIIGGLKKTAAKVALAFRRAVGAMPPLDWFVTQGHVNSIEELPQELRRLSVQRQRDVVSACRLLSNAAYLSGSDQAGFIHEIIDQGNRAIIINNRLDSSGLSQHMVTQFRTLLLGFQQQNSGRFFYFLQNAPRPDSMREDEWLTRAFHFAQATHVINNVEYAAVYLNCPIELFRSQSQGSLTRGINHYKKLTELIPDKEQLHVALQGIEHRISTSNFFSLFPVIASVSSKRSQVLRNILVVDPHCHNPARVNELVDGRSDINEAFLNLGSPERDVGIASQIAIWSCGREFNREIGLQAEEFASQLGWQYFPACYEFLEGHVERGLLRVEGNPPFAERFKNADSVFQDRWSNNEKLLFALLGNQPPLIAQLDRAVRQYPQHDKTLVMRLASSITGLASDEYLQLLGQLLQHSDPDLVAKVLKLHENPNGAAKEIANHPNVDPVQLLFNVQVDDPHKLVSQAYETNLSINEISAMSGMDPRNQAQLMTLLSKIDRFQRPILFNMILSVPTAEQLAVLRLFNVLKPAAVGQMIDEFSTQNLKTHLPSLLQRGFMLYNEPQFAESVLPVDPEKEMMPQLGAFLAGSPGMPLRVQIVGTPASDAGGPRRECLQACSDETPQYFADLFMDDDNQLIFRGNADPTLARQLGNLFFQMSIEGVPLPAQWPLSTRVFEEAARFTPQELAKGSLQEVIAAYDDDQLKDLYNRLNPMAATVGIDEPETREEFNAEIMLRAPPFEFGRGLSNGGILPISPRLLDAMQPPADLKPLILENLDFGASVSPETQGYVRRWVEGASLQQLEFFVRYVSGVKTLPPGKKIAIRTSERVDFYAHSCMYQVDLRNGIPNYDDWKLGFEAMLVEQGYSAA